VATTAHCAIDGYMSAIEASQSLCPFNLLAYSGVDFVARIKALKVPTMPEARQSYPCNIDQASLEMLRHKDMDSSLLPAEITVRHFVNHKFTLEFGPSIISLGKAARNTLIAIVVIKCSFDLVQAVLSRLNTKDR
jgi:hypothetical protein